MRRILSLTLTLAVCCPSLVALCASPARAQEVASVGNLGKLREQYEQLLAIERDPATPPDVRELNHTFLEERRAQLAAALRERIGTLRKYQSDIGRMLSLPESRAIEGSIQRLIDEMKGLEPAAEPAPPAPPARRSRRPVRVAQVEPVVELSYTDEPESRPAAPAAPNAAAEPPARREDPIVISAPSADTSTYIDRVEVEVEVNDDDINNVMVVVYAEGADKPFGSKLVDIQRSDRGKKKIAVSLRKGENRIEVTSSQAPAAKAVRKITYKPEDAVGAPTGRASATQSVNIFSSSAARKAPESGTVRVGAHCLYADVEVYLNDAKRDSLSSPLQIIIFNNSKPIKTGTIDPKRDNPEKVAVRDDSGAVKYELWKFKKTLRIVEGENTVRVFETGVGAPLAELTVTGVYERGCNDGHLVGMLVAGTVASQQADRFSQNDPFMGFIGGYSTERGWFPGGDGQLHYQFQGIFQVQPKTGFAPFRDLGTANATEGQLVPFLASRKSFDIEGRIWADWGLGPSKHVRIGPYFSVAGTTYVSKNELRTDDPVQVDTKDVATTPATPAPTQTPVPTATPASDSAELDLSKAKVDNDIDMHIGGGMMMNVFNRDNSKLFMNVQIGYENFEGLSNLNKKPFEGFWGNSRNRIVGKLRIFPGFLDTVFEGGDSGDVFSPMFGVDLNAGRGPDQLKFFIGGALGIKAFTSLFKGRTSTGTAEPANPTPANPAPANPAPGGGDEPNP